MKKGKNQFLNNIFWLYCGIIVLGLAYIMSIVILHGKPINKNTETLSANISIPFSMVIDGEETDLWFDKNLIVYSNRNCTEPYIAPSGYPYSYAIINDVVVLVDDQWPDE